MRNATAVAVIVSAASLLAAAFSVVDARDHRAHWIAEAAAAVPDRTRLDLDDPTIVAIFDGANTADIETGQLAVERGQSKEVRDFGAMLVRDHRMVRQQGRDLAKKLGVTPTPPKDDQGARDHAAAMQRLRGLRGAAFDHAFLQHEAAFHESVIGAVKSTLLPAIRNEELKALVVKVAPAFEAHMIAARNLDQKLAAGTSRTSRGN
jgi:putative membrane protein